MKGLNLIIGNKKYSSWSFRPWLLLKMAGIPFRETQIFIRKEDTETKIHRYSPAGRVPVLVDGDVTVWESIAICEYLAEKFPNKGLWPKGSRAKAVARSVSHEMHAGFQGLRQNLPCNFLARYKGFHVAPEARPDIDRIGEIWRGCREQWGKTGPFLFGKFSVADAMYAPVVFRFLAYGVKLERVARAYMHVIETLPASKMWVRDAASEIEIIPVYENVNKRH